MVRKFFKSLLSQKGQALVLYALLVPLFIILVGAVIDLGWYYINYHRLQNAADAAAIAGAKKLIEDDTYFTNYKKVVLISKNNLDFDNIPDNLKNESVEKIIQGGDETALEYVATNLTDSTEVPASKKILDTWTNKEVTFSANLFAQKKNENVAEAATGDETEKFSGTLYYQVELDGKANHIFKILDNVTESDIKVFALTQLVYQIPPPPEIPPGKRLSAENVISGNWELEDAKIKKNWEDPTKKSDYKYKDYLDNYFVRNAIENNYPADKIWLNYNSKTNSYTNGNFYRSATVDVSPNSLDSRYKTKGYTRGDNGKEDGHEKTREEESFIPDSLTLGFRQDIVRILPGGLAVQDGAIVKVGDVTDTIFEKDWDIRQDTPYNRKTEIRYIKQKDGDTYWKEYCDLRTHNIFNFNTPFDVRTDKVTEENPYDILWVRIESEAFLPLRMLGIKRDNHFQYKSVRQIILNIGKDNKGSYNTEKDSDGQYKYRPVVFFYDGPERFDMNSRARTPRPIILNLNADFRGAIFAPTTAVIINDNGHKFYGFIVAKEYRKLATGGGHRVKHNNSNVMYVDDYGEVLSDPVSIYKCGDYDTFNIGSLEDYNYELEEKSANNLFTS